MLKMLNNSEFIKFAAKMERSMDSGEVPHVVFEGDRYPITSEQVEKFGLVSGQTISKIIMEVIRREVVNDMVNSIVYSIIKNGKEEKSEDEEFKVAMDKELKSEMGDKVAKTEDLFKQQESQNGGTEDVNQKIFPEAFSKVDWPDPKEDKSFDNIIMGNLPEATPMKDGPEDTFNERTSENFSSGKPE